MLEIGQLILQIKKNLNYYYNVNYNFDYNNYFFTNKKLF